VQLEPQRNKCNRKYQQPMHPTRREPGDHESDCAPISCLSIRDQPHPEPSGPTMDGGGKCGLRAR
jgi:hypothetical protein